MERDCDGKDHVLTLAEVDAVAKTPLPKPSDVLAVLALLSRPGAELLTMDIWLTQAMAP